MFKKRALQVKVVKTNDNEEIATCEHLDLDKIDKIVKEQVKHAAIAAIIVIGVSTVLHTLSEIAINAAKPKEER